MQFSTLLRVLKHESLAWKIGQRANYLKCHIRPQSFPTKISLELVCLFFANESDYSQKENKKSGDFFWVLVRDPIGKK